VIDGLVSRALKPHRFGYTDPVIYATAMQAMTLLSLIHLALICAPIHLPPVFFPVSTALMTLPLRAAAANLHALKIGR
jgi:hypothetical protein